MFLCCTCNPCIDGIFHMIGEGPLRVGETNRVKHMGDFAAGKGVNAARVLSALGEHCVMTGFLGANARPLFDELGEREKLTASFLAVPGRTRRNLQIFSDDGARTEILSAGFPVDGERWDALLGHVRAYLDTGSVRGAAVCGSMPEGVTEEKYLTLLRCIREAGVPLFVDAEGKWLDAALRAGPTLVKPNRAEAQPYTGGLGGIRGLIRAGKTLRARGAEQVLLSLGGDGAMLFTKDGILTVPAPEVRVRSTLGCGDSMVAACMKAYADGMSSEQMLEYAAAVSAANAMTAETAVVNRADAEALLARCRCTVLREDTVTESL